MRTYSYKLVAMETGTVETTEGVTSLALLPADDDKPPPVPPRQKPRDMDKPPPAPPRQKPKERAAVMPRRDERLQILHSAKFRPKEPPKAAVPNHPPQDMDVAVAIQDAVKQRPSSNFRRNNKLKSLKIQQEEDTVPLATNHNERLEKIRSAKFRGFKEAMVPSVNTLQLDDQHAVLRLSLGRQNGWTNAISSVPSNPRYHSDIVSSRSPSQAENLSTQAIILPDRHVKSGTHPSRQIFLWVYKDPNHIHMVTTDKTNPSSQLREYVEKMFYVESDGYTLASLVPGVAYPIPIMKFASDINKGFVICLPTKSFIVHIAGSNNDDTFSLKVNPLQTVKDLKTQIQQLKGYPISIQDLLFDGHVLQNKHLVIDYKIANACRVHLFLQPCPSFAVYVETFWGKTYTVEVSPCSNSDELLNKVFRKTLAKPAYREQIFKTRTMYQGLVLVEFEGTILDKKYCLNYYGINNNSTLNILSTSQARRDRRTVVDVLQDTGMRMQVKCAPFDTWFVIGLHLHGMTTLYIDMMKLLISDRQADLQKAVGSTSGVESEHIQATLVMLPPPSGMMHKLTVHVATSTGSVETVHCGARETIKDVKRRLEHAGVDYAAYHDILYKKVRLPSNTKLYEYKLSAMERCLMDMKLNEFPVCVEIEENSVKLPAHHDQAISVLLKKIEDKLLVSPIKHCIIHAGEDLYSYDALTINETYLFINSHLYIEPISGTKSLHLVAADTRVPLPSKPTLDALHVQQLSEVCADPEAFTESLKWFLKWRYPMKTNIFNSRRQSDVTVNTRRPSSKGFNLGITHISPKNAPNSASHNNLHERAMCRPGSRHRRHTPILINPKATDVLRNAISDEEVYAQQGRQMALFPDIAHNNKTTDPSQRESPGLYPKPSIKISKSTDNIFNSESRETIDSFASVPATLENNNLSSAKKKLSVRFEIPEGQEPPHREHKQRYAWQTTKTTKQVMTSEDLMEHYQRLRLRTNSVRRSQSDRASQRSPKLNSSQVSNVAVKFSMNV